MTLPSQYNPISMGDVRTELNKSSGPISLNDSDVRILFQIQTGDQTAISLHDGHGKSNIQPPKNVAFTSITQTSLTVSWKPYESLVIDGLVENYYVEVYDLSNIRVFPAGSIVLLPQSTSSVNITGLVACSNHALLYNYTVKVSAKNVSATKTTEKTLLTLESQPTTITGVTATTTGTTTIRITGSSTFATSYNIYRDGTSIPTYSSVQMPYDDTVSVYTLHTYEVQGHSTGGDGNKSSPAVSATSWPNPPVKAVISTITATQSSLTVNWTQTGVTSTEPVDKYRLVIEDFNSPNTSRYDNATITVLSQTVSSNLTANTQYTATLYTINNWTLDAAHANLQVKDATNWWTTTVTPTVAPTIDTPTLPNGQTQLVVRWTGSVTGATSYNLQRYNSTTGTDVAERLVTGVIFPYTDSTGIVGYNLYRYSVIAVNLGGSSAQGPLTTTAVRTLPGPAQRVSNLTVSPITITNVTATAVWDAAVDQVSNYTVVLKQSGVQKESKDVATNLTATVGQSPFTYVLTQNTGYAISVITTNENNSATTNDVSFTTRFTAPSPPTVVSPAVSKTALTMTWPAAATGVTGYKLKRQQDGSSTIVDITPTAVNNAGTMTFTDTTCSSYETYAYALSITNITGDSVYSSYSSPGVRTLPADPTVVTGITATAITTSGATINWTKASGQVTKYRVQVVQDSNSQTYLDNTNVTGTSINVTGLAAAKAHTITITTYNEASPTVGISTTGTFTTKITRPTAPVVTSPATAQTSLTVSWNTMSGATSHDLVRYTSAGSQSITGISSSPFIDTVIAKTEYWYTLIAQNNGGPSDESPISNKVTTLAYKVLSPGKPTAEVTGTSSITVSWTAVTGADSYKVYRYPGKVALGTKSSGFSDTGLTVNTPYTYTVTSYNTGGESDLESPASDSVTTWMTIPGAIVWASPTFTNVTTTSTTINWTAPTSGGAVTKYVARTRESNAITSGDLAANATSYTFSNTLSPWYTHEFYVTAYNTNPTFTDSTMVSNRTLPNVPNKPALPTTSNVLYNSITITCAVSQPNDAPMTYIMYRNGTNAVNTITSGSITPTGTTGTITFTDTTVSENTAYWYYVQTHNENNYSIMSDSSTPVTTPYAPPAAPAAPTISFAPGVGTKVTLSISSANATSYAYSYGTSLPTSASNTDADGSVVIADGTLSYGLTYYFVATATTTANGLSATSALSTGYTYETPPAAPAAPTLSYGAKQITLSWTANTNYSYEVYRQNVGAGSSALLTATKLTFGSTSGTYTDSSTFADSTTYSYQIKVYNASDKSAISTASTSFKTPAVLGTVSFTNNYVGFKTFNATISCTNASTFYVGALNNTQTLPSSIPYSSYASLTFNHSTDVNGNSLDYTYRYSVSVHAANYLLELPPSVIVTIPWNTAMSTTAQVNLLPGTVDLYSNSANVPYDATKITVVACGGGGGGGGFEAAPNGTNGGKGGDARVITATFNLTSSIAIIFATVGNGGAPGSGNATSSTAAPAGGTGYAAGGVGGKPGSSGRSGQGGGGGGSTHVYGANSSNVMLTSYVVAGGAGGGGGGSANQAGYAGGPGLYPSTTLSTTVGEAGTNAGAVNGGGGGGGGGSGGTKGTAGKDGVAGTRAFGGEGGSVAYSTANVVGTPSYSAGNNGGTAGISLTSSLGGNGGLGKAIITFS